MYGIENFELGKLIEPLQNWFADNARVLPWRETPTAYKVWVSEIMLQQTRVEAVKPYFDRFIGELPEVKSLAECPEDKLLKLWEGLGYYNRVRNMKIAAKQVMEEYGGVIPSEYEELLKLKGIGHYTAGAISSIAYGKAVPAVDGNVLRVITRVAADYSDIMKESTKKKIETHLFEIMNDVQEEKSKVIPSVFNQALMELGATVCVPNGEPHCDKCPWNGLCETKRQNLVAEIPVKTKAKERRIENKTVLIIKDGEQLALHKRPAKGLLAGLYELPNLEGHRETEELLAYVKEQGYEPIRIQPLCDAKHIFSHVEWHMKGYVVFVASREITPEQKASDWIFVDVEETKKKYAIPSAFSKFGSYLNLVLGKDAIKKKP
ncbi:MAG: A/G-specific adenine glycosylase [Agathobacter sp.]